METQIRVWRVAVQQGCKQAPTFFVETTEKDRDKAEVQARKMAQDRTALKNWKITCTKMNVRIDRFGRYVKHHQ